MYVRKLQLAIVAEDWQMPVDVAALYNPTTGC